MEINTEGRKIFFSALVGSHNYGLAKPSSDRDYKMFVLPTFEDLYNNKQYSKDYITEDEDVSVHDARKLPSLFFKSNINFVETLFSTDFVVGKELNDLGREAVSYFLSVKEDIARMNLPFLYDACVGMHKTKLASIDKGTASTQKLIDTYHYETKMAEHSLRPLFVLMRYCDNNFNDFRGAINFSDHTIKNEEHKKILMNIRYGSYCKEYFLELSDAYFNIVEENYKKIYKANVPDTFLHENLNYVIASVIKDELLTSKEKYTYEPQVRNSVSLYAPNL